MIRPPFPNLLACVTESEHDPRAARSAPSPSSGASSTSSGSTLRWGSGGPARSHRRAPGRARVSAVVFSTCVALCFGASALYHRPTWSPNIRSWLARLDHAGVYLLIAGTYAPFGLLVLSPGWAIPVLTVVWNGVAAAIALKVCCAEGAQASLGRHRDHARVGSGSSAISQLLKLPAVGLGLVLAGGVFYTLGGIIYARRQTNPNPRVLGYHEIFHLLTLVAASCQYAAIAFYVLPRACVAEEPPNTTVFATGRVLRLARPFEASTPRASCPPTVCPQRPCRRDDRRSSRPMHMNLFSWTPDVDACRKTLGH